MEVRGQSRPGGPAATGADPTGRRRPGAGQAKWYVVLQGDVVDLVHADSPPSMTVKKGERRKRIVASNTDRAKAETLFNEWSKRARGVAGRGVAI